MLLSSSDAKNFHITLMHHLHPSASLVTKQISTSSLKNNATMQRGLLKQKLFFHFIKSHEGMAVPCLAFMNSYQCGSAKNVIKKWVINLMLVA